jgi:hypothetical protein
VSPARLRSGVGKTQNWIASDCSRRTTSFQLPLSARPPPDSAARQPIERSARRPRRPIRAIASNGGLPLASSGPVAREWAVTAGHSVPQRPLDSPGSCPQLFPAAARRAGLLPAISEQECARSRRDGISDNRTVQAIVGDDVERWARAAARRTLVPTFRPAAVRGSCGRKLSRLRGHCIADRAVLR